MGCWQSRIEREETVSRCKARKRYMKQFVKARRDFSSAHAMYIRSLRTTASSLLHFANTQEEQQQQQTILHYHLPLPQPPPMTPTSDTWTSLTASPAPPPPVTSSSVWEFWDPFLPPSSLEEDSTTTTVSKEELAMVVSRNNNNNKGGLVEIVKELQDYFLKAADTGTHVSLLLEVPSSSFSTHAKESKVYSYGWSLSPSLWSWGSSPKLCEKVSAPVAKLEALGGVSGSHCSTVERLYTWEKKLCQEVKNVEAIKVEHEKKVARMRKLEMKRADYEKTEKTKEEVEKLESQIMVASHAIETTNDEIIKLRETELYPQLIELVKGLMCMWRSMHEYHQVQKHIVQHLEYLNTIPSINPTSEIHRQSTLKLELEIQQWHQSFCNLFKAQRDYIQSLTHWLRLSLFQFSRKPINKTAEEAKIYTLCEEWNHAVDRIPDKLESEGINTLLTAIRAIVVQQTEEYKQKRKLDAALKELEKDVVRLQSIECKYPMPGYTMRTEDPVTKKRAKVEHLRAKVEEEKTKHEKSISATRAMTLNNLQMSFPQVFQGIVRISSACVESFESVYNKSKIIAVEHDVKRILH